MALKYTRIIVLAFGIFVPIYILIVFLLLDFRLEWLPFDWAYNSKLIHISANYVAPILFCIGWMYFLLITGKRFASTIELMGKTSSTISAHYIIFYGVCAVVMLIAFLIPILTPIVCILSFSSMIFSLLTSKVNWDDLDDKTKRFVKVFTAIVNIPVIFCTALIIYELFGFSITLYGDFIDNLLTPLYNIMKALGVALPIGNFWLLYRNAIGDVDGKNKSTTKNNTDIVFAEIAITVGLFLMEQFGIEFVQVLYYFGIGFWLLSFILNGIHRKNAGKRATNETFQNPLSLLMFGVFWVATTIFGNDKIVSVEISGIVKQVVVSVASFVFILVFLLIFIGHPDLED